MAINLKSLGLRVQKTIWLPGWPLASLAASHHFELLTASVDSVDTSSMNSPCEFNNIEGRNSNS
jgi:hypothetical protein